MPHAEPPHTPRVTYELPLADVTAEVAEHLSASIQDAVSEGVRRGRLPSYMRTKAVTEEFGLSDVQQRNLRARGKISYHRVGGSVLYCTEDLLRELDELRIPHTRNSTT